MTGDWRGYRPAIWTAMLGVALMLLVSPAYLGAIFVGFAIGIALKVARGQRAAAGAPPPKTARRRRHR